MGMWESDNRGGGDDNFIKPGEKRGGIEGRRARGGGDFRRRGASGDYGGGREGGRGPISRAVSDEDLFESLFGDQGLAGVDIGGGSAGLAGEMTRGVHEDKLAKCVCACAPFILTRRVAFFVLVESFLILVPALLVGPDSSHVR